MTGSEARVAPEASGRADGTLSIRRSLLLALGQAILLFVVLHALVAPLLVADLERFYTPTPGVFAFLLITATVTGALVWFGSFTHPRRPVRAAGWTTDGLARAVAVGLVGALACVALLSLTYTVLGATPQEIWRALSERTPGERVVFFCIGLQAALTEETLFRGNLLPALERRLPGWAAVLVSAAVFAVYHLNPQPAGLLTKLGFGVVFACAKRFGGSLVAPAVAHAVFWVLAGAM